jgi:hypothetical protein
MNLKGTGWEGMDWINLAHYRDMWNAFVNIVMDLQV